MGKQDYKKTENRFINPYNFVKVDWNKTTRCDINQKYQHYF